MKKTLFLMAIVVLCLCIGTMSFATTLSDIKGTKYQDAVENLIEVGLVNGYEDNTYRPNVAVTRAQMAKLMVIALGEEGRVSSATMQPTTFTDMNSSHWAYGYVNVAKDIGVINGYTDGSFDPDETVSYAEATTMAVRALGFEDKVKQSKESWPNNYISCAKELELFKNIGTFDNNTGAARGDVAILLWNMLNTGVSKIVAQNDSGLVYGQGELMLSKYKNYTYMEDGAITDVDFDKDFENATVVIEGKEKLKLTMSDDDVLKYLGKKLTILYNEKSKKVLDVYAVKHYKEDTGEITKLTSKKIYIDDEEYPLPDEDDIFLYKVDDLDDALEATVYLEGSKVKYILAQGAKKLDVALVTKINVTVNKESGITMKKVGSSSSVSYALSNSKNMPSKYSVIFYSLDKDDKITIVKEISDDDAKSITSVSTVKIKVGSKTYEYDSKTYLVYSATTSNIKTLAFRNIDEDDDLAYVYEQGGKTYVIVFEDAADSSSSKNDDYYDDLLDYIDKVKSIVDKESKYTQESFVKFLDEYNDAKSIKSSATAVKINTALNNLKSAYESLQSVSSTSKEGKISSKRADLRTLVNGEAKKVVNNSSKYTTQSYNNFYSEYTAANKILSRTNTTLSEVTDVYEELEYAISKLVLASNTQEHKDALTLLNNAISRTSSLSSKDTYTESSYNTYLTAYNAAVLVKNNAVNKTAAEIKTAAQNLNNAIDKLELALDSVKEELSELIVECLDIEEDDYTPASYDAFEEAFDKARTAVKGSDVDAMKQAMTNLNKAKNALELIDDELDDIVRTVDRMKTAENVASALNMSTKTRQDKLDKIDNIKNAVKEDLRDIIRRASEKAAEQGAEGDGSLDTAIGQAKSILNSSSSSLDEKVDAYVDLNTLLK